MRRKLKDEHKWVHVGTGTNPLLCGVPERLINWNYGHIWCDNKDMHNFLIYEKHRKDHVKYYPCPVCYTDEDVEIATIHLIGSIGQ